MRELRVAAATFLAPNNLLTHGRLFVFVFVGDTASEFRDWGQKSEETLTRQTTCVTSVPCPLTAWS